MMLTPVATAQTLAVAATVDGVLPAINLTPIACVVAAV